MKFFSKIKDLLFYPDIFFEQLTHEKPNLITPALIVILSGIGSILSSVILIVLSAPVAGRSAEETFTVLFTPSSIFSDFILPLLLWTVAAISIYLVSRKGSGTGSLKVTFQNVGYGTLPAGLYSAVNQMVVIAVISANPEGGASNVIILVLGLGSSVFIIWIWYLWLCGTIHAHRLPMGKAIIGVAVAIVMQGFVWLLMLVAGDLGPRLFG